MPPRSRWLAGHDAKGSRRGWLPRKASNDAVDAKELGLTILRSHGDRRFPPYPVPGNVIGIVRA